MKKLGPDLVRAELARVLANPGLARSQRLSRLLSYLVEQTLNGQPESLKETVLGIEIFGRPPGWDPKADSTVRMHVARLRENLREYYSGEGRRAPLIIEIPKGAYVPQWRTSRSWERPALAAVACLLVALSGVLLWRWISARSIGSVAVPPLRNLEDKAEAEVL